MWVSHIQMPPTKNHRTFDLNDYSRSAGGNHEHRAISSNGLIVERSLNMLAPIMVSPVTIPLYSRMV